MKRARMTENKKWKAEGLPEITQEKIANAIHVSIATISEHYVCHA